MTTRISLVLGLLAAFPAVASAAPTTCPGGRFLLVDQAPLVAGARVRPFDAVVLEESTVAIASGCEAVAARLKAARRGQRVRAVWPRGACPNVARKVRLTARFDPGCTRLRGKLLVGKKKRRFEAQRSTCDDGVLDRDGGEQCATLQGPADGRALDAVHDVDAPTPIPSTARDTDAQGAALVRTRIEVGFAADATVAQVNAIIERIGGRIVSMLANVPSVVLDVPDPGSVPALDALVAAVAADPVVVRVLQAREPIPDALPENFAAPLGGAAASRIDHHLAVRAAAAWNARTAMRDQPTVAILDYFGDGPPDAAADVDVPAADFSSAGQGIDGEHGYHVLGIVAGSFGGAADARGQVTGMVPDTTLLRVVDIQDPATDFLTETNRTLQRLRDGAPHGILNTSLGSVCGQSRPSLEGEAVQWANKMRALGLENRVLHLTTTGNVKDECPDETDSDTSSFFAAAALLPLAVPNLTNVLVVENAVNGPAPTFAPTCLAASSKFPGNLSAIGTTVFSLTDASSGTGNKDGTSMASPQVAGLAAYLWALAPEMSVQELRQVLLATAKPVTSAGGAGCSAVDAAPVIDAYEAVLALDAAALPDPQTAPIRQAILDVDDDGRFDDADVAAFVQALIDPLTGDPREPADPDFGRHDLNGDGFTGGARRPARFDLDRIDAVQFGKPGHSVVTQTIAGADVSFDEAAVSDLDVLCYYAHSDLFDDAAGTAVRDAELSLARCTRARLEVIFPAEVTAGVAASLFARVFAVRPDGVELAPLPGVHVELDPDDGTVGAAVGVTDANGIFTTTATATAGASRLDVDVVARTAPGGTILAGTTVTANVVGEQNPNLTFTVRFDGGTVETSGGATLPGIQRTFEDRRVGVPASAAAGESFSAGPPDAKATLSGSADIQVSSQGSGSEVRVTGTVRATASNEFAYAAGSGGCAGDSAQAQLVLTVLASDPNADFDFTLEGTVSNTADPGQSSLPGGGTLDTQGHAVIQTSATENTDVLTRAGSETTPFSLSGDASAGLNLLVLAQAIANTSCLEGPIDKNLAAESIVTFTLRVVPAGVVTTSSTSTTSSSSSTTTVTSTTSTTSSSSTTLPGGERDPYRVYNATGPDGPTVTLADALGIETVDLGSVLFFLTPAGIDGQLFLPQTIAQACYEHPGAPFAGTAEVTHRLGSQTLQVGDPVALCAPSETVGLAVDHYACHAASGDPLDQPHALADELQAQNVQVLEPFLFCLPVSVEGGAILDPVGSLTCYLTDPPGTAAGPVAIANAFHTDTLDVAEPVAVCVPSRALVTAAP